MRFFQNKANSSHYCLNSFPSFPLPPPLPSFRPPSGHHQVHRAQLLVDGQPTEVAVKVRHPGVADAIWLDFQLLRPLAALTARVPSLRVRAPGGGGGGRVGGGGSRLRWAPLRCPMRQ